MFETLTVVLLGPAHGILTLIAYAQRPSLNVMLTYPAKVDIYTLI